MSFHIGAKRDEDEVAKTILIAGDPSRAKHIAEKFLTQVNQFNEIRGALGFTGFTQNNKRISVMGTGMGMATTAIYVEELISEYDVQKIIRVGTCGSLQRDVHVGDIVLAQGSCFDNKINDLSLIHI